MNFCTSGALKKNIYFFHFEISISFCGDAKTGARTNNSTISEFARAGLWATLSLLIMVVDLTGMCACLCALLFNLFFVLLMIAWIIPQPEGYASALQ